MQLKRIVNLMPDDKFLDYYIEMSERFIPGESSYLILTTHLPLRYVKSQNPALEVVLMNEENLQQVRSALHSTSVVIFHSFKLTLQEFVKAMPGHLKKVWLFWGFEGYQAFPKSRFIGAKTHSLMYERSLKGRVKCLWDRLKGNFLLSKQKASRHMIRQMDYVATFVKADAAMIKSIHPTIQLISFSYYTTELMQLDEVAVAPLDLKKILLGNSGDPTNNHIEALYKLRDIHFSGKIICPMSYGGNQAYLERVCQIGAELFGAQFQPLKTFMPLKEYHELLSQCGIVWMNHKRQQAAGNLLVAFIAGKVVILDKVNPLSSTFKEWGLAAYTKEILGKLQEVDVVKIRENRSQVLKRVGMEQNEAFFSKVRSLCKVSSSATI